MYQRIILIDDDYGISKTDRERLKNEVLKNVIKSELLLLEVPKLSYEIFKKTSYEKELLVKSKKKWREEMKVLVPNWTRKCDYYVEKRTL